MKTNELTGPALDWAVAKCENPELDKKWAKAHYTYPGYDRWMYMASTDWAQGGPIIEREQITIRYWENEVFVTAYLNEKEAAWAHGPTPLIAAMRCYVASKMGAEVEVPDELKWG